MGSIPLPALAVGRGVTPAESPLDIASKAQALKSAQQEQEIRNVALQQQRLQLQDQQTIRQLQPQFVKKDDSGKPVGYDWDGLISAAQGKVAPQTLFQLQQQQASLRQATATATKDELENQKNINGQLYQRAEGLKAVTDPNERQQHYMQTVQWAKQNGVNVGAWPAQAPDNDHLTALESEFGMHSQALADQEKVSSTKANEAKAESEMWKPAGEGTLYNIKTGQLVQGVLPPDRAAFQDYLNKGGSPSGYPAWKAEQEAKATQPYKIQVAQAEAAAKQALEGNVKPVYAIDPKTGAKSLMSQTDGQRAGMMTIPVTEKQVGDDVMLINRLGDVRQKIARYEDALQKDVGFTDRSAIQHLLESDQFKMGAFGTQIPVDYVNKLADQFHIHNLSPEARDQIIAYYNAREALIGYQRVLAGSARSSDSQMQLQEQTLPSPATTDKDFSRRSLGQFKENLAIVGQGLPKIPGVKTPEEWEQQAHQQNNAPTAQHQVGDTVTYQGKPYHIKAIRPDGKLELTQ